MSEKVGVCRADNEGEGNIMQEGKNIYKIERNREISLEETRNKIARFLSEMDDGRREVETIWEGEGRTGITPRGCNW